MGVSVPAASKASGLSTVLNVITAPGEAFETLRISPMWGWAFVVALILTALGGYLAAPATSHAIQASWPAQIAANPRLAAMTPAQQQSGLNFALAFVRLSWLFAPITVLVGALVSAVVMLIFNAAGKGSANFKQLWCAAMNAVVVSAGVSALLGGLIAVVRGAASYNSTLDAYRAIPGLAWLVPHATIKTIAFLSAFNVVGIWAAVLFAIAMMHVARTSKANSAFCAATLLCLGGALLALGAR